LLSGRLIGLQAQRRDRVAIGRRHRHGHERAANAERGGWGFHPHVAGLGDLRGDKAHRPLHQVDHRRVRRAVGLVDELVERHARVFIERERAAVGERDRERRVGAGLDDVALKYEIADIELDGYSVAYHGRRAGDRLDAPDRLLRGRWPCLRVLTRRGGAGQEFDHACREERAFRRGQVGVLLLPEVIGDEDLAAVLPGQNEVGALAMEIGGEEEVSIGDGHGRAARLDGNRRRVVAQIKRLTLRVNHDLTWSGRLRGTRAPGMLLPWGVLKPVH
jgi:hypothetical protein